MKTKFIFIVVSLLAVLFVQKSIAQYADCNNLFLDADTFYISNQQPVVTGNINYLDTNWTVYPVLHLILSDTSIITSPDMNFLSFLVYPTDTIEQFNFNINFKTTNYSNNTMVNGFFHIYDSDMPGDSIVTCYFPITLVLMNSTGVNELENRDIIIYPNPGDGNVAIDLRKHEEVAELILTNSLGQEIIREQFKNISKINYKIDSRDGIYYIKIHTKSNAITYKVIKY